MGQARVDRILLVWPKPTRHHTQVLSRKLDLVLVHRHASRLGAHLGIVAGDETIIDNASELGLPIFNSVSDGHLFIWRSRRSLRPAFSPPPNKPPTIEQARTLLAAGSNNTAPHPAWRLASGAFFMAIGLLSAAIVYFLTIPAAEIRLTPANQRIIIDIDLTADPTLNKPDYLNAIIPAQTESTIASASIEIPTTGLSELSTNASQGTVIFTNLTTETIRVPAGTAVRTSVGIPIRFVTQKDVELPDSRGMIATAPVKAVTSGPAGNISPSLINRIEGPLQQFVAVTNRQATTGGEHITIPSVTSTDRSKAYEALLPQLRLSGYSDILASLPPHLLSTPDSANVQKVIETNYSHFVGEHADTLTLEIRATITATIVDDHDAYQASLHGLKRTIRDDLIIEEDTISYNRSKPITDNGGSKIYLTVTAMANAIPRIDPEAVTQLVRWHPVNEASETIYASLPLSEPPKITVTPGWLNRLPWLSWRTNIVFNKTTFNSDYDHTGG